MITRINNLKNSLTKLTKVLMIGALISLGLKANAQCNANYTYTTSPGGVINFTNTSIGSYTSLFWSFGNGASSSQGNPVVTFASNGSYSVCLTISDSMAGCFDTFCDTIVITNGNALGGCAALFTPFDSAGYGYFWNQSTAANSFVSTWDFGDGSIGTSTLDIVHQYGAPGTYNVCLTITDTVSNCSDTMCSTITIGQGSGGACNAYFSVATNSSVASFTDLSSGSPLNYFWDFGDGSTSTTNGSVNHTYALNGTYYACLTIGDSTSGCSDSYCGYVTIGNPAGNSCNANFYLVQDSTNIYNYTAYSYASTGMIYSYFWDFGDGTSSTSQYPTHVYPGTGPYLICLTVTDNSGCTATFCDSLYAGRNSSSVITLNVVQASTAGVVENELINGLENYPNPFSNATTISYNLTSDAAVELSVIDLLGNTITILENSNKHSGSYKIELDAASISEGMYLLHLKANNKLSTKKLIINK